ncbi:hypothetical protein BOTCAL_0350g00040 [Botryotinia calthae]|uniref:Uncharacterized protein n=1 Tax=Botryotinia calthae TaxID=38488 RepID=A0A4Y8CSM4_9HELO|nr:hypothetical protein BOTCAL_0350g00040 [Botryotinia calthae]
MAERGGIEGLRNFCYWFNKFAPEVTTHELMILNGQSEPNAEAENQAISSSVPTTELLGLTIDRRLVISLSRSSGSPHPMARHLSTPDNGRPIYIYGAILTHPTNADANMGGPPREVSPALAIVDLGPTNLFEDDVREEQDRGSRALNDRDYNLLVKGRWFLSNPVNKIQY